MKKILKKLFFIKTIMFGVKIQTSQIHVTLKNARNVIILAPKFKLFFLSYLTLIFDFTKLNIICSYFPGKEQNWTLAN